jgi:hypothetical protein
MYLACRLSSVELDEARSSFEGVFFWKFNTTPQPAERIDQGEKK